MAIPPNFNPTISRQSTGNKATIVIKKQEKDNEVAGGKAAKGSGGSQDHDAYLRQQIPVIEAKVDISVLPEDVLAKICSGLSTKKTAYFAQVSKTFNSAAKQSAENRITMLIEKLNVLISNSGITGIQMPAGPFSNSIHELSVLETLEKNLSNAINVLKDRNIKDINERDKYSIPLLHLAASRGQTQVVKALITAGANVNQATKYGVTPLHYAVQFAPKPLSVYLLINAGADVNARDDNGTTPLHYAAFNGFTVKAQFLLAAGADINAWDDDGTTPINHAFFSGKTEFINMLNEQGQLGICGKILRFISNLSKRLPK